MQYRAFGWLLAAAGAALTCVPAHAGSCDPDTNNSGNVDFDDLLNLLAAWGPCPLSAGGACVADINGDNVVDVFDLTLLLDCWGPCPCRVPVNPEIFDTTVSVDVTDATAAGLGLSVTHLYATGALVNVGDELLCAQADLSPNVGTTFYQDAFGTDLPANPALCPGVFPSSCYDTFVTMREIVDASSGVTLAPGFSMSGTSLSGSWFGSPVEPDREAVDISGITGTPGQAGVLIAQISLVLPPPSEGPSSVGYGGNVRMWAGGAGGEQGAQSKNAFIYCPWDCQPQPDGNIGINDFLELLNQWPSPTGGSCDFNFDGTVGINDFLDLLGRAWGPCPG